MVKHVTHNGVSLQDPWEATTPKCLRLRCARLGKSFQRVTPTAAVIANSGEEPHTSFHDDVLAAFEVQDIAVPIDSLERLTTSETAATSEGQ